MSIKSSPGYYRVNYDAQNWKLITVHLKNPKTYQQIAPANRAQLIDDALNLARGSYLNYDIALDVTKYLSHETEYVPWKAAINAINFIDAMLLRSGDYYKFKVSR
jgi:aminopeptidase N